MAHDRYNCYFSFWVIFLSFYSPENENIKKNLKIPRDIIILHKCTKNHNHMLYCSWDMAHDGYNYFSFWVIFCPFTPLTAQKIKISKKWKKHLEISLFYTSVPKIMIIYAILFLRYGVWRIRLFFILGIFFTPLPPPPKHPKKWKFQKSETTGWRYHHFTQEYQKSWLYATLFLRYGTWWM